MEKRYYCFDIAKGIGIILVILGHAGVQGLPNVILYSFHIPLFFFLSGLFLRYDIKNRKEYITKRLYGIMGPYFLFYFLYLLKQSALIVIRGDPVSSIVDTVYGMLLQMRGSEWSGKFWFLPIIFQGALLCFIAEEITAIFHKKSLRFVFVVVYYLVGYVYITIFYKALPFNFDAALIAASFMMTAIILKKTIFISLNKGYIFSFFMFSISLLCNIISAYINFILTGRNSDLYWMVIGNPILYLLAGFFGIFSILYFSMLCHSKMLAFIGRNSLLYYCLHHEFIFPVVKIVIAYLPIQELAPYYLTILSCIIITPICFFINKYKSDIINKN